MISNSWSDNDLESSGHLRVTHNTVTSAELTRKMINQPDFIRVMARQKSYSCSLLALVPFEEWKKAVAENAQVWVDHFGESQGPAHARVYIHECLDTVRQHFTVLRCSLEWLEFLTTERVSESIIRIAKLQEQGVQMLLNEIWDGHDSMLQIKLLRRKYANEIWPVSSFFQRAWAAFVKRANPEVLRQINYTLTSEANSLFWGDSRDHRHSVVNLPVLLGFWSMTGVSMSWWHHRRRMAEVERVRFFAPEWFDSAYQHGVMLAIVLGAHAWGQGEAADD